MRSALALGLALCLGGIAGTVQASPISGNFNISIWHTTCSGCSISSAEQQANSTNPLKIATNFVGNYDYSGAIDFNEPRGGANDIYSFLTSSSGSSLYMNSGAAASTTGLGSYHLSTSGFQETTLMEITGNVGSAITGTVTHDDGATIYQNNVDVTATGSGYPTIPAPSTYSLQSGDFTLYYVEANGLPAQLTMNVDPSVPEPSSLALIAFSLLGLGLAVRRKRSSV